MTRYAEPVPLIDELGELSNEFTRDGQNPLHGTSLTRTEIGGLNSFIFSSLGFLDLVS